METKAGQELQNVSANVLSALADIDPHKPYSPELYGALARLMMSTAIETVALRKQRGQIEVFLIRRELNDLAYPGQLHSPGSILRPGETYEEVVRRLEAREFHTRILEYVYVDELFFQEERGWFNCRVFFVNLEGEPPCGEWAQVDWLPEDVIPHHRQSVIPMAVGYFLKHVDC